MRFKQIWGSASLSCLALCAATLLSACGGSGGSSGSSTQVRLLNASVGYSSLDLSVNSAATNTGVAYGSVGSYASVDTSATSTQILTSGVGATVANLTPTLAADSHYTIIAYGWGGAVRNSLLQEVEAAADANKTKLLVLNLAPDAGALDVYITTANNSDSLETATPVASGIAGGTGSGYNSLNAGTFRITLTGTGKPSDIRLDLPSVTLDSTGVATLIATATSGGRLVNGMVLKQQSTVSNLPTAKARVRVAATMSSANAASVNASIGGLSVLPSTLAPQIGAYTTVDAGAPVLDLRVNGIALNTSNPTLKAGGDYTLLVWGTAASPQLSVLSDDNRLPTASGTAKIRLINGLSGAATGLGMAMDYSSIASNVAPGSSSSAAVVNASATASLLTVNSPASSTAIYSNASLIVPTSAVFSLFMMGDPAAPIGQLVRDDR
jgi:hypothetical protein